MRRKTPRDELEHRDCILRRRTESFASGSGLPPKVRLTYLSSHLSEGPNSMNAPPVQIFSEDQRKHLDFIQATINRLAGNSFQIKAWSVAIIAGILAVVAAKDSESRYALIGLLPALVFWYLDASYFRLERKYRALYEAAAQGKVPAYSLDTSAVDHRAHSTAWLASTWSVAPVHGTIVAVIAAIVGYGLIST